MKRLLPAMLLFATQLTAQTVRGRITESGTAQALVGAFVTLLDSTNTQHAGVLTDSAGFYIFRQTPPGRWAVRAEVIGHQTQQSSLFNPAATPIMNLTLPVEAISLAAVEAKASHKCVVRPQAAEQTMRVWDDARKALQVAAWALNESSVTVRASTYRRSLTKSLDVTDERVDETVTKGRAYAAIDPASLADKGFMQIAAGDSLDYYGPDADVLLSDEFLSTHCFGVVKQHDNIGLAFKPIPGRKVPDIKGTLWLAPNGELRYIEFEFIVTRMPYSRFRATGRTDFKRLASGVWLVDQWYIRSPVIGENSRREFVLLGYGETGGHVVDVKAN